MAATLVHPLIAPDAETDGAEEFELIQQKVAVVAAPPGEMDPFKVAAEEVIDVAALVVTTGAPAKVVKDLIAPYEVPAEFVEIA